MDRDFRQALQILLEFSRGHRYHYVSSGRLVESARRKVGQSCIYLFGSRRRIVTGYAVIQAQFHHAPPRSVNTGQTVGNIDLGSAHKGARIARYSAQRTAMPHKR